MNIYYPQNKKFNFFCVTDFLMVLHQKKKKKKQIQTLCIPSMHNIC